MSIKKGIMYVFLANMINLIVNLLTTFFLPKFLSIDTYANIKLFKLYVTYLGILHFGFADGMYLRLGGRSLKDMNKKEVMDEFETFKLFQFIINIIMIVISLVLHNKILFYCSLIILPVNISNYIRNLYNAIGEFKKYSIYTNINTIMIFIINLVLLFIIKTDSSIYYISSYIVIYFLYWIFIEIEINKIFAIDNVHIDFDKKYLKDDIKSGCLLMLGNFCNTIFTSIDRLFVQKLIGMAEFAHYSFAASIENLLNVFISPISTTMYNYFCKKNNKNEILRVKKYILLFSSFIIITIFPAKFIIEHWISKYNNAIIILFILIAAQYFAIMVKVIHVNIYKSKKMQSKYFKIMLFIIITSIILNILLYLIFKNMISIAIATLITNIIWFIIGEIDLKEYHLRIHDYIYYIMSVSSYLICSIYLSTIIGCLIYLLLFILLTVTIEYDITISFFLFLKKKIDKKRRVVQQ